MSMKDGKARKQGSSLNIPTDRACWPTSARPTHASRSSTYPVDSSRSGSSSVADYAGIEEAVRAYLATLELPSPRHAAIAIANPIDGDFVRMTNRDWAFSIEETRRKLELDTLLVVNDFTALAQSLPRLSARERSQVGGGRRVRKA